MTALVASASPAGSVTGSLDVGRRLMAFNWLTAGYAHRDWLGPWAEILEPRPSASLRLIRRASIVLLDRYDLRERYVRDLGGHAWLMQPHEILVRMANVLGTAMLGGWVKSRLERQEVAQQIRVLGVERRKHALEYAQTLRALPYPGALGAWPVPLTGSAAVFRLGVSCMSALLDDVQSGARERYTLRFAAGMVTPLILTPTQRDESLALIHATLDDA